MLTALLLCVAHCQDVISPFEGGHLLKECEARESEKGEFERLRGRYGRIEGRREGGRGRGRERW